MAREHDVDQIESRWTTVWQEFLHPRELRIALVCFPNEELRTGRRWLRRLLGLVVRQAMQDGMTRVRFAVDEMTGEASMRYFGPVDRENRAWWDMVPPPADCHPTLLEVCISLAGKRRFFPINAAIPTMNGATRFALGFHAKNANDFELSWDEKHAGDPRTNGIWIAPTS